MTTLDLFTPPPAPPEVRPIHEAMEARAETPMAAWRRWLREHARALQRPVTTDDLWRAMDRGQVPPIPEGSSPNVLGSVFSGDPAGWRAVGWERSTREGSNGNALRSWAPREGLGS